MGRDVSGIAPSTECGERGGVQVCVHAGIYLGVPTRQGLCEGHPVAVSSVRAAVHLHEARAVRSHDDLAVRGPVRDAKGVEHAAYVRDELPRHL